MQTSSLLPPPNARSPRTMVDKADAGGLPLVEDSATAFACLRAALAAHLAAPADTELWQQLLTARQNAAAGIARLPRKEKQSLLVEDARALVREISASGIHDRTAQPEDLALADAAMPKGWQGLLSAMLLVPAWQWPDAPNLLSAPDWLREDFVTWLFAAPQGFIETGHAEKYAAYTLKRLEELVRWVNRSPGASAEAEVLVAYATKSSVIPLYFSQGSLRRHAELRGQLLRRMSADLGESGDFVPTPRAGRRLRVGIVNRHFGPQTETYTTLPTFEQLDTERFEVVLFSHSSGSSPLEAYCRQRATEFFVLPEDVESQLSMLRGAALDVVVFGTNLTAIFNEVTRLALHRVAPLQIVNNSSCITSGLPEIDLYVSGSLTESADAPTHFSERLGLLPGPAHAFNYTADQQEPQAFCTRAEFGLPEDALVFVSAANYFKIIPEMQHAWARLLAATPGSRLLVHPFNPNWSSSYPIARFRAEFERVLTGYGVEASRLAISTVRFPSRADVKTLLGLGDVYLDSFPFGGVNSLVDPLELGLPVVVWEGGAFRSRMGGALLRTLDLGEFIATNETDFQAIAVKLATDATYRQTCKTRIAAQMERNPIFLDPLAASEAFGDLVEAAFDELAQVGRKAFRANPLPLRASQASPNAKLDLSAGTTAQAREVLRRDPANAAARHLLGRSLLEAGRSGRAVTYLLAALQGQEDNAALWLDIARALRAENQMEQAMQALEASLRIDESQLEGWLMLADLAQAVGVTDLAREAATMAKKLAPTDERAAAYL